MRSPMTWPRWWRGEPRRVHLTFTPSHRGGAGPPLVCLHGFMDTWRTWELVLPALERHHEVLAPTLPGHAGGPTISGQISHGVLADAVERAMDQAGFDSAHLVGNSLGGHVALQLAARGRAKSVVVLAPAGGWAKDDDSYKDLLSSQRTMYQQLRAAGPNAISIVDSLEGRRRVTGLITTNFEHIPVELLEHQMLGAMSTAGAERMIEHALVAEWILDAEKISCPVRIVWGTEDKLLPWPRAAARYRHQCLPQADWIVLDGIGHCPQLDTPLETAQLILGFTSRVHRA
jgi:pimeloyl-ACP methyl ester carboxylesterase